MDQVKIGKFIQSMRKEQKLTQRQLADKLGISDKTVSKWETGNGLPDVSLMMPLCQILNISANELLSAQKLDQNQYYQKAEENVMDLVNEKQKNKKLVLFYTLLTLCNMIVSSTLIFVASFIEMNDWQRILFISIAFVCIVAGAIFACVIDNSAGYFECRHCGERFVPSDKSHIFAIHTITTRRLKCPKCGKTSYCKKRLSK